MSKRIIWSFFFILFYGIFYVQCNNDNLKSYMEFHQVVPDIIPEAPKSALRVIYNGGISADNGNELTPAQVKNQPEVIWNANSNTFYTLMLVSPDAPSRKNPTLKELQNWLVVNILGNDIANGNVLAEYVGSGPPSGTGLHRYIFLLYKQSSKIFFDEERISKYTAKGRFHFSTVKFAEKYNLGSPIAGTFFQAQYDYSVPEIHKQLGVTFNVQN